MARVAVDVRLSSQDGFTEPAQGFHRPMSFHTGGQVGGVGLGGWEVGDAQDRDSAEGFAGGVVGVAFEQEHLGGVREQPGDGEGGGQGADGADLDPPVSAVTVPPGAGRPGTPSRRCRW